MESLFALTAQYNELYDMLTDKDVDEEVVKDSLDAIMGEIEVKGEGYVTILNRLDAEMDACKKQADIWNSRYAVRKNAIERLKQRLSEAMIKMDKTEIKAGDNTIKLVNNGGQLPLIIDEDKTVPDSYMKVIYETDKVKIRKALEEGQKLDFAHIGTRGKHISIK